MLRRRSGLWLSGLFHGPVERNTPTRFAPPPPLLVYTDGPRKDTEEGGFSLVAMLYRSNILALVGGGRNPRYATNKVILFDEKVGKPQAELEFRSDVKNIVLRRDQYELG